MEINGEVARRKIIREMTSPDRARTSNFTQQKEKGRSLAAAMRKVQVVYYLSRNGQLEHPHFMEISHFPHQLLRLKDVIDRLTVLRGKGMPSLFSWSCKRSYKNGYVWNDLSENDLIYPVDGAEYVLKGSEIIHGCTPANIERFQHLQLGSENARARRAVEAEDEEEETTGEHTERDPHLIRCSRGVSTDEIDRGKFINEPRAHRSRHTEIALDDSSPPSSSSSDKASAGGGGIRTGCASFRFDDGETTPESGQNRNSILLQLISCGSIAVKSGRAVGGGFLKPAATAQAALSTAGRKCTAEKLHRMSEKEYFSGSIVEGMEVNGQTAAAEPALKKSSSYNEERGAKLGMGEDNGEEVKGKCIPGRKRSSAKQQ
ncbi:hypothetical protein MA16_Dca007325 [Dendrobium catenatum]|uniref:SOSEKI DIX-like domain-containing protein n=1 Tax=Dendrobium catenatum TaxID=906689 RepID=A0A2I0W8H9_9ASPA|nr:hypothetical protein MA16_Dca007325 [Dendrobium catenatum]